MHWCKDHGYCYGCGDAELIADIFTGVYDEDFKDESFQGENVQDEDLKDDPKEVQDEQFDQSFKSSRDRSVVLVTSIIWGWCKGLIPILRYCSRVNYFEDFMWEMRAGSSIVRLELKLVKTNEIMV